MVRRVGRWGSWVAVGVALAAVAALASADTNLGTAGDVTYMNDFSTDDPANVKVACPGGKHVASGGFGGGYNGAEASVLAPFDGQDNNKNPDDGWRARLSGGDSEAVGGDAICKPGKLTYVRSKRRTARAGKSAKGKAVCPSRLHVIGGGASARIPAEIDQTYPADGKDRRVKPDDAWRVRVDNTAGDEKTGFRVHAICQRTLPVYRKASEELPPGSGSSVDTECPLDRVVVGAGVKISGPADTGTIDGGVHSQDDNANDIPEDSTYGFGGNLLSLTPTGPKIVTGFAICQ